MEFLETAVDVVAFVGIGLFLWSVSASMRRIASALSRQPGGNETTLT
jgi:hypothetical protein